MGIFGHDVSKMLRYIVRNGLTKPDRPREDKRVHKGRVVFGAMDEVVFGRPAAEAVVEQTDRLRASRAFLLVSGTLNRQTDEIDRRGSISRPMRSDPVSYRPWVSMMPRTTSRFWSSASRRAASSIV